MKKYFIKLFFQRIRLCFYSWLLIIKEKKNRTLRRTILIAITKAINITLRHIDKLLQTDIIDLRYIEKHPQEKL